MVKCFTCRKKIPPLLKDVYLCRCNKYYCGLHRHEHTCEFDHHENQKSKLVHELVTAVPDQIKYRI